MLSLVYPSRPAARSGGDILTRRPPHQARAPRLTEQLAMPRGSGGDTSGGYEGVQLDARLAIIPPAR
ncbi:hypothetical protein SAMN05216571_102314 [Onishia taeanensis]|uniref:Uncharacterized protein n=1 Tax=Onishia taeanensis TaxID=284577 RepID=A0A1G7PIH6_9GAMM|nr:hypothetical protein SAMN05216571_102314 [Halomonas taeanensis]